MCFTLMNATCKGPKLSIINEQSIGSNKSKATGICSSTLHVMTLIGHNQQGNSENVHIHMNIYMHVYIYDEYAKKKMKRVSTKLYIHEK